MYIFISLSPLSTVTRSIFPIHLLYFFFFLKKTAYNLFSKADCSKLSPVINKQRGIGKARGKEKDRSSVALIGTTSHTEVSYHSHQQQPCFTSCLPVPCFFPLLRSVCACLQQHWPISSPIKYFCDFLFLSSQADEHSAHSQLEGY